MCSMIVMHADMVDEHHYLGEPRCLQRLDTNPSRGMHGGHEPIGGHAWWTRTHRGACMVDTKSSGGDIIGTVTSGSPGESWVCHQC